MYKLIVNVAMASLFIGIFIMDVLHHHAGIFHQMMCFVYGAGVGSIMAEIENIIWR